MLQERLLTPKHTSEVFLPGGPFGHMSVFKRFQSFADVLLINFCCVYQSCQTFTISSACQTEIFITAFPVPRVLPLPKTNQVYHATRTLQSPKEVSDSALTLWLSKLTVLLSSRSEINAKLFEGESFHSQHEG